MIQSPRERVIQNAFASARMEGSEITPEIERNARRIVSGEATIEECVREILSEQWRC
jgi:hypothetical protein